MRILLINHHHFHDDSAGRYFANVMEWLAAAGHECIPFSFQHEDNTPSSYRCFFPEPVAGSGVGTRFSWPQRARAAAKMFRNDDVDRRFRQIIEFASPDLVYVLDLSDAFVPNLLKIAAREYDLPIVHRLSDFQLLCPSQHFQRDGRSCTACLRSPIAAIRHRCVQSSLTASALRVAQMSYARAMGWYDHVDLFLAPSRFLRDVLTENGISKHRVAHLPTAVNDPGVSPPACERNSMLYLGRISAEKGVEVLVRAFAQVRDGGEKLILAGPIATGYADELRRLAGVFARDRLQILPRPDEAAQAELLRAARFVVHPALSFENMPDSIISALAASRAVMASNIGSIPEVVTQHSNGWLVEPGDVSAWASAMERALFDPHLQAYEMEARAAYLGGHLPQIHTAQLLQFFAGLCESKAARTTRPGTLRDAALSLSPAT